MTIEHVNVEYLGQATVGHIEVDAKQPREGAKQSPPKSAKALEHKPGEVLDTDLTAKTHSQAPAKNQT